MVAVVRARGDDARIHRLRIKTMHKINVAAAGDAAIERTIRLHNLQLIPADLRDFVSGLFGETNHLALKNAEAGGAGIKFLAAFKQCLITHADTEKRFAGFDKIFRSFKQFLFAQGVDAIIERPNAGQHEAVRVTDFIGALHKAHVGSDLEQRFVDAAQVAGAVVE